MTEIRRWTLVFDPLNEGTWDEIIADGPDIGESEVVEVIEAKVTDEMVERIRESLWSTWGAGRQTTDWPSHDQLRAALEKAFGS